MNIQSGWRSPIAALALAVLLSLVSSARAQTSPGITDDTVTIGITGALTGPAAALGAIARGIEMRIMAANDAGGVKMRDGKTRKIKPIILDDAAEPQRTLTNARRLVESDNVLALVGTTTTAGNQAIASYVTEKRVPNLFLLSALAEFGDEEKNPWAMSLTPSFPTEAGIYAEYLKKDKPNAKAALLYLNTDMGLGFQANFKSAIAASGIQLVAAQPSNQTDPTVDTQMTTLRASGADTLLIVAAPRQSAQAVRWLGESGWKPTTFVFAAASSIPNLRAAGLGNAKGVLTVQYLKPVDPGQTSDPAIRQYLADHDKYRPRFDKVDALGQHGYVVGEALLHVLQNMTAPTRQNMMDTARNFNKVSLGLLLPGITLTTKKGSDGFLLESLQVFQFDGTAYKPVGEVISFEGRTPKS